MRGTSRLWPALALAACSGSAAAPRETLDPRTVRRVPYAELAALQLAGRADEVPFPAGADKVFQERGRLQPAVPLTVCVDRDGRVATVEHLASADGGGDHVQPGEVGPAFLEHYRKQLARWRFKPYERDGARVPVCSTVIIHYALQQRIWTKGSRGD